MIRIDLLAWGAAVVLAGGAGLLGWRGRRPAGGLGIGPARLSSPALLACAALLCLLVGQAWRFVLGGTWPGTLPPEALIWLAAGGLLCGLWLQCGQAARTLAAGTLIASAIVVLAAWALAWGSPGQAGPPQARIWLFGLCSVLAGLGLGGWLSMSVAMLSAGLRFVQRKLSGRLRPLGPQSAQAAQDLAATTASAPLPLMPALPGARAVLATRQPVVAGVTPSTGDSIVAAIAALRFSFPWLTAALLCGGLWNLVAYAAPWRSRPAELWLSAVWLAGAACLQIAPVRRWSRWHTLLLGGLALCGLVMALLAAGQVPTLFA